MDHVSYFLTVIKIITLNKLINIIIIINKWSQKWAMISKICINKEIYRII